jgi:hypothetical protein
MPMGADGRLDAVKAQQAALIDALAALDAIETGRVQLSRNAVAVDAPAQALEALSRLPGVVASGRLCTAIPFAEVRRRLACRTTTGERRQGPRALTAGCCSPCGQSLPGDARPHWHATGLAARLALVVCASDTGCVRPASTA